MNSKKTNRNFLLFWLVFHIGVIVLLVISYIYENGKFALDSDLLNMMPKPFEEESLKKANETLMQKLRLRGIRKRKAQMPQMSIHVRRWSKC